MPWLSNRSKRKIADDDNDKTSVIEKERSTTASSPTASGKTAIDAVQRGGGDSASPVRSALLDDLRDVARSVSASVQEQSSTLFQESFRDRLDAVAALAPAFIAGTFTFHSVAATSTYVQWKVLKISTGTRPAIIPTAVGLATIAAGSWLGHLAGIGVKAAAANVTKRNIGSIASDDTSLTSWIQIRMKMASMQASSGSAVVAVREAMAPMLIWNCDTTRERTERKEAWNHTLRVCLFGILAYRILGGRFSSVAPSSYTSLGSFARFSVPAPPNFNYATRLQRTHIERLGRRWGCHTCGSRMMFPSKSAGIKAGLAKFHGDHVPPVSVAKQLNSRWYRKMMGVVVKQKFYPQCRNCSNKQGGLLARAVRNGSRNLRAVGGGSEAYFHGRRLRVGHLAGGFLAAATAREQGRGCNEEAGGCDDVGELVESSREIFLGVQRLVEVWAKDVTKRVEGAWSAIRRP